MLGKVKGLQEGDDKAFRLLLRKAAKALDAKESEIAILQQQKREYEAKIKDLLPKKRIKVIPDPNKAFIELPEIQHAQCLARDCEAQINRQPETEGSILSTIDFILS